MAAFFYVLECTARGCDAEFLLNDIPVTRRGPALGANAGVQVNELVVDGVNELAVVINPGPTPALALAGEGRARRRLVVKDAAVEARLARYPRGAKVRGPKAEELLTLKWSVGQQGKLVFPRVEASRADLGPRLGKWAWQSAPQVALDAAGQRELGQLLATVHAALDRGSPEALLEHSRVRLEEIAAAYELEEGEKEQVIRTVMAEDAAREGFGLQPIDEASFSLRTCARGRLVEVLGRDWKPVLREKPAADGSVGYYDMFVARIDGAWQIVR